MKITLTITEIDEHELTKIAAALGGKISIHQTFESPAAPRLAVVPPATAASGQTVVAPSTPAPTPAAAPAAAATAPAAREPGADDGAVGKAGDEVFGRCTTLKEVCKEIVRRDVRDEAKVLAEVVRLQEAGVACLKPIAPDKLPDRVRISLTALGVLEP